MGEIQEIDIDAPDFAETTSNLRLDSALAVEIRRMCAFNGVTPKFGTYDDRGSPNALYVPGTPPKAGTVALGRTLIQSQLETYRDGGFSLLGILAHECGHALQDQYLAADYFGEQPRSGVSAELHADFLAGFYLAYLQRILPNAPFINAGRTFEALADAPFSAESHGDEGERRGAINFGHAVGMSDPNARPPGIMVSSAAVFKRRTTGL